MESLEFGSPIAARRGPPMARAVESMTAAAYGAVRPPDQVDFGVDGLPAFSPNALALLTAARDEAAARGHPGVGTEHVLWALVQPGCGARVKGWLGEQMQPAAPCGDDWQAHLLARLDANPLWAPSGAAAHEPPPFTASMVEVFGVVREFAAGPVRDGACGLPMAWWRRSS